MKWIVGAALIVLGLIQSPAWADSTGSPGFVAFVQVFTEGSDEFNLQRGNLTLEEQASGDLQSYLWGGTLCGNGRDLDPHEIQILMDLAASPYMLLLPLYKPGPQEIRCLVGFSVFNSKYSSVL